ncbi:MAG: fructosamine kinase family protein [Acidimicrobiales bacterium]
MGSSPHWLSVVADLLGPVTERSSLGAGVWRIVVGGRRLVAKQGRGVLDEARGLSALAAVPGAPPVPEVVAVDEDEGLLVTTWVTTTERTLSHDEDLGRSLAELHRARPGEWGGGSSFVGGCPVDAVPVGDASTFYGHRLTELARAAHLENVVLPVVNRLVELLPPDGPSLVHGDLWWGNVLWGVDGRAWLIDPSIHGGHPEEDLAMLALFGPIPGRLLAAYTEVQPLSDGWLDRRSLFQLVPLLVHAVLFGNGYPSMVREAASRYT